LYRKCRRSQTKTTFLYQPYCRWHWMLSVSL
jgi:hypothetical protein